jgi:hypothetical protein
MGNSAFHLVENPSSIPLIYIHVAFESPTLREEHRLKGFKNRVLRKIFRLKRQGAREKEPHDFYVSSIWVIKLRRIGWMGHV